MQLSLSIIFSFLLSSVFSFQRSRILQNGAFKFHNVKSPSTLSLSAGNPHDLVVWDCDGVLVDSEALLKQGEVEALARAGIEVSVDDCVRLFSGVSVDEAARNFMKEKGKSLPEHFFRDQIAGSMQLFRDRLIPLMTDTGKLLLITIVCYCHFYSLF